MFNLIAVFFVCSGIGIAVHIAYDLTSHKQSMKIMNVVWILTALWGSYLALWAYNKFGQSKTSKMVMPEQEMTGESMKMDMNMEMDMSNTHPQWQSVALSTLHCGAGCTLADIIGEWITVSKGIVRAFKADFFSLTSWQVGMYGWMAIVYFILFVNFPLAKDSWQFWFMMQIAMLFGFIFAFPMNALLLKLGIKKGM